MLTVKPKTYEIDAFFAGVGGLELGFEQTGRFQTLFANEFDKFAQITYHANHPKTKLDTRDIHKVKATDLPNCDLLIGGFPCQAFSIAGYRAGFKDDRGNLFFEMLRLIKTKQPRIVMFENVKNLVTHDHGNTFKVIREALVLNGYHLKWQVLNSKDYGNIPQNRERIYLLGFRQEIDATNFTFPAKIARTKTLPDVIDFKNQKDEKYYYRQGKQTFYDELKNNVTDQNTIYQWRRHYVRANQSHVVPTLTANMGTGGHNVPLILTDSHAIRKLTPHETFNVQGFPTNFILPAGLSNAQLYKQAGNSVTVPVIKHIATNVAKTLDLSQTIKLKPITLKKYALIAVNLHGAYCGESYLEVTLDNLTDLQTIAQNHQKEILTNDQYLKALKSKKPQSFYLIKKL